MCGILGGNIKSWDYYKGIQELKHRGPDLQNVVDMGICTLAFARLSIMDLSDKAMQPMKSENGMVSILYNGEIYGFQKLRNELRKTRKFYTTSDTEVVLNAYMEYGDQFINYIDGMFAIVIYDRRQQYLKIYRDRYGIKPLYYYVEEDRFAFASEIKAIISASKDKKWQIENTALYDYLCYQYIPEPKSIYKNIFKLEPAHCITYDLKNKKIIDEKKYWKLHVNTQKEGKKSKEEIAYNIKNLIKKSVEQQMTADVKVGTFLSGGIDSSIITYESNNVQNGIEAYSIGFKEKEFDESRYSKIFVDRYGINQKLKYISSRDIIENKSILRKLYDEPFGDTSAYPTFIVSKFARKDVKVVLTGDGADELFGGYQRYANYIISTVLKKKINNESEEKVKHIVSKIMQRDLFKSNLEKYQNQILFDDEKCRKKWR